MAVKMGKDGSLKIGTDEVARVQSWSINLSHEKIDSTSLGDDWMKSGNGLSSWTATVEMFVDTTDSYNGQMITAAASGGDISTLRFYEDATNYWAPDTATDSEATAQIESATPTVDKSGIVSMSISVKGHGPITRTS